MSTDDNVRLVKSTMDAFLRTGSARMVALADMSPIVDAYRAES